MEAEKENKDWWDNLSELEKRHIQEGLDDIENGRVMTSEEFWARLKAGDTDNN